MYTRDRNRYSKKKQPWWRNCWEKLFTVTIGLVVLLCKKVCKTIQGVNHAFNFDTSTYEVFVDVVAVEIDAKLVVFCVLDCTEFPSWDVNRPTIGQCRDLDKQQANKRVAYIAHMESTWGHGCMHLGDLENLNIAPQASWGLCQIQVQSGELQLGAARALNSFTQLKLYSGFQKRGSQFYMNEKIWVKILQVWKWGSNFYMAEK